MTNSKPPALRALFIDFDGVLHPTLARGATTYGDGLITTTHFGWVQALEEALRGHDDVRLVVHSTWRYQYKKLEELRELLGVLSRLVVGPTPLGPCYESITWWLHSNPNFSDYRILDDDPSEFPVAPPLELIVCNPLTGVSAPDVLHALGVWLRA